MRTKLLLLAWLCLYAMQATAAFTLSGKQVYTIKNTGTSYYASYHPSAVSNSVNYLSASYQWLTGNSYFVIEDAGEDGCFTIRVAGMERYYVYAIGTGNADSNVGVKQLEESADIGEECKWIVNENGTGTYNIIPKGGSYSWNKRGTINNIAVIGQWNQNDNNNNKWQIEKVDIDAATEIAKAQSLLAKAGKVGYPQTTTTSYTELETALNAAQTAGESATNEQIITLAIKNIAFTSYGVYPGETDIVYPEVGKAYTMTFSASTGKKFYMNYAESGYTCVETSELSNENYPDEAVLLCVQDLGSHKYVFRNLNRKYFAWKGGKEGYNGNKGYADSYQDYTYATIGQFLKTEANGGGPAASSQSDVSGAVTVKGLRNTGTENYFVYKFTTKTFDQAAAYYYTTQFTSAVYMEEKADVEDRYDFYTISVTGTALIGDMGYNTVVTRTSTGESDTQFCGFFASSEGIVPDANDFTATDDDMDINITVDGTNKVVNVARTQTTDLTKARHLANRLLRTDRVGYPSESSALRTTLSEAAAGTDVDALNTAISNYMSTQDEDIILPKDGQAYTMTAATKDGKKFYMKYTDDGYTMVETTESDNTNYPEEAILICRDLRNGKYAFQNTAGKYMCWKGTDTSSGAYNSNKGFSDTYSAANTWIGVEKIVVGKRYNGTAASNVDGSQSNLFGAVAVKGYRNDADNNNTAYYVINQTTGAYNRTAAPYYKSTYTSAILIEPVATVTYNPQPPMNNSEGAISEEIKKVATYSAPIATVVPSNVKAYYVSASEGAGGQATLVAWPDTDGQQVLPDNTGVILTSTDADATLAALTPATTETVNELPSRSDNLLQNTAAGPHTFAADEGFILAKGTYGVGLYKAKAGSTLARNKAYLDYSNPSQSASTAVRMVIGGNTPTDITHLMPQEDVDEQAPIYDLSGRRVQHTVKGGLYIRNGRKFIVR